MNFLWLAMIKEKLNLNHISVFCESNQSKNQIQFNHDTLRLDKLVAINAN